MLAETLGWPVSTLLEQMSSLEITKWIAYFKVKQAKEEQRSQISHANMSIRRR